MSSRRRDPVAFLFFLLATSVLSQQTPPSPCQNVFRYENHGGTWTGVITASDPPRSGNIRLQVKMSIPVKLPTRYVGKLTLYEDPTSTANRVYQGAPVMYRVEFPLSYPLPNLVQIIFANRLICSGPPSVGLYVTTVDLNHDFRTNGAGGGGNYLTNGINQIVNFLNPQPTSPPVTNYYDIGDQQNEVYVQNQSYEPQNNYYQQPQQNYNTQQPQQNYNTQQPQQNYNTQQPQQNYYNTQQPQQNNYYQQQTTQRPQTNYVQSTTTPSVANLTNNDVNSVCGLPPDTQAFIHGGVGTARGEWPWLVALFHKIRSGPGRSTTEFKCGATLISANKVLTAGHCVTEGTSRMNPESIVLRLGAYNIDDPIEDSSQTRSVYSIRLRDDYSWEDKLENDIAVLVMARSVTFTKYIRPVCMWSGSDDQSQIAGLTGTVVGWGRVENQQLASQPRLANVPIVSKDQCRGSSSVLYLNAQSEGTFCAGARDGTGPCVGDSGGGLFMKQGNRWAIRGLVSLGVPNEQRSCDLYNYVVFTDVSKYAYWISQAN